MRRIVLAYSGGVETSVAIPWLADHFGAEIVAVVINVGRESGLVEMRERALALGAVRCHVIDAREEFARDVLSVLQADAFYQDRSPQLSALARPLIARTLVDVARMEHATVRTISEPEPPGGLHQIAANLWGRSVAVDVSGDPEEAWEITRSPDAAPDQPAYLEIEFDRGTPIRVNGIEMLLLEMIESLETIGGVHGVGRTDTIVARPDGTKYRDISETPAATLLHVAYRELEALPLPAQSSLSGSIRLRLFKGECRVAGRAARVAVNAVS